MSSDDSPRHSPETEAGLLRSNWGAEQQPQTHCSEYYSCDYRLMCIHRFNVFIGQTSVWWFFLQQRVNPYAQAREHVKNMISRERYRES